MIRNATAPTSVLQSRQIVPPRYAKGAPEESTGSTCVVEPQSPLQYLEKGLLGGPRLGRNSKFQNFYSQNGKAQGQASLRA